MLGLAYPGSSSRHVVCLWLYELLGDIQVKGVGLLNLVTFLRAFYPSKQELRGEVTSLDLIWS